MNNPFTQIIWAQTSNMIYSPLVVCIAACLAYRFIRAKKIVSILTAPQHSSLLIQNFSLKRESLKIGLLVLGALFLFLALMRPCWDKKEEKVAHVGRDLFVALDISRSMLATDCKPNRLACAKKKIHALLNNLSFDRVGLILFSGSSFVQCPLTSDYHALSMFLNHIDVETISSGTTALDQAIGQALQCFQAMPERKNKLLVLFTDGEDFSSNLSSIKQQAAQAGMHIFTMGVGTAEGAPIPILDEHGKQKGHQKDKKGSVVISHLNEGILSSLADDSGGQYIRMETKDTDIKKLIASIVSFEKEKLDDKQVSRYQEQYPYFLAVALACFALEWIL